MNRIKELRRAAGLSQQKLAKKLNVTGGTLSNWENDKFEPNRNALFALADIFNVSTDYLLGRVDEPKGSFPAFSKTKERSDEKMVTIKLPPLGTLYCSMPGESIQQWELVGFRLDRGKARLRAIGLLAEDLKRDLSRAFPNASIDEMCTITVDLAWLNGREVDSSCLVNSA